MNEDQIRAIVRNEMDKNYSSGSPDIPPHAHNGNDNLQIDIGSLLGVNPIRQMQGGQNFLANLTPAGSDTGVIHPAQYLANPEIKILGMVPVIQGNGSGVQGAFNGGDAPIGTVVCFANGNLSTLWVKVDTGASGGWVGVVLDQSV